MKKLYIYILIIFAFLNSCEEEHHVIWDQEKLNEAKKFSEQIGTSAFMLYSGDSIVAAWGDTVTPTFIHSVRNSITSTIYAIYTGDDNGQNTDMTLEELGIDDSPDTLTKLQKQARVIDLIKSKSGINHAAAGELESTREDKFQKLGDSENIRKEIWAYNNWDYNALVTIFEQQTGTRLGDAFLKNVASPLGMQDINENTVIYSYERNLSEHPIIHFKLSARDMLKFGILCLNKGNWKGNQLVPVSYFNKIVSEFSRTGMEGLHSGQSYLWWVPFDKKTRELGLPNITYNADGLGHQQIMIIPEWKTVIVHKSNTNYHNGFIMWLGQRGFSKSDSLYIRDNFQLLQDEFIDFVVNGCKDPGNSENPICQSCNMVSDSDYQKLLKMIIEARIENDSDE